MGRTPKYSKEGVVVEFLAAKDAPNEQLTHAFAQEHYDWVYSAGTHYGKKPYDWYGALEKLYELHGGMTNDEAKQKVEETRMVGKRKPEYTERQIAEKFLEIKDAPNEELKRSYAQKHYKWYSSACTRYGEGKNDWYGALEKLYELHGGMTNDEAKQKMKEIQRAGKRGRKLKYTEQQIAEKFLRIKDAPNEQLTMAYAIEHYDWSTSACTHYGKKPSDWYGLLEELFTRHGGMNKGQARRKVEEVRLDANMQRRMRISIALRDRRQIHGTPANRERMRQFAGGAGQAQGRARLGGMQPPAISVRAKRVV